MKMSALLLANEDPRIRNAARRVRKEDALARFAEKMKSDPEFALEHQNDPRVTQLLANGFK